MPLSIGVNLRVTGHCNQGGRKYMEDMFSVAYQQSSNDRELEYAFFGIFDGHGGGEAAVFAKENLMDIIVKQKNFWSDKDEDVLRAIRDGYVNTHYAMWRELEKWPKTASGLPSTAGTTASIAFIRKGKIYIGHVGDSAIILGYQDKDDPIWKAKALTKDHKPECCVEMTRIQESGGKVVSKSGVPRVVWNRPRIGHKGPVRRSTHIDEIPFLAVARSLGDLWSYNSELNTFVVSPEPDVKVLTIDVETHRCLIFGTDGLWNMLTPQAAVSIVQAAERHNEKHLIASQQTGNGQNDAHMWINPSKSLVDRALDRWSSTRLRADNTSVVTLMLDPPGPSHSDILLKQKTDQTEPLKNRIDFVDKEAQPAVSRTENLYNCLEKPSPLESSVQHQPMSMDRNKHGYSNIEVPFTKSPTLKDASIQVAEVSSSNSSDETFEPERSIVEADVHECDPESNFKGDESEKIEETWLQDVPVVENFVQPELTELQPVAVSTPCHQRSNENSRTIGASKRKYNLILRPSDKVRRIEVRRTRRHSTGMQQQRIRHQRRSLTPKATFKDRSLPYLESTGDEIPSKLLNIGILASERRQNLLTHSKKRMRSSDRRDPIDENDPANEKVSENDNIRWTDTSRSQSRSSQERRLSSPNSFKRRNLEKKVTPVKTLRRSSINRTTRIGLNNNWDDGRSNRRQNVVNLLSSASETISTSKRWLRSDTVAATPTKTLRSRNVDLTRTEILKQCTVVKANHVVVPTKIRQSSNASGLTNISNIGQPQEKSKSSVVSVAANGRLKQANCSKTSISTCNGSIMTSACVTSGIARRKSSYNLSARSLNTRRVSRIKRFSK